MVHDLLTFMRGSLILIVAMGFLYLSAVNFWNRFIRLKTLNYLGIGFFFMGLGTIIHFMQSQFTIFPSREHVLLTSILLNSIALFFIWIHFQFMQQLRPSLLLVTVQLGLLGISSAGVSIYFSMFARSLLVTLTIVNLTILTLIALLGTIKFNIFHYLERNDIFSLLEGVNFIFLLLSIIGHDVYYFHGSPLLRLFSGMLLLIGSTGLIVLYTWRPHLMYRIPYSIWFLLGYHDSGMFFYRKQVNLEDETVLNGSKRRMPYLSSLLAAMNALFKHVISQEVVETVQKSHYMELLFIRDPSRQIGYLLIAEKHSRYLKQALLALLRLTPVNELFQCSSSVDSTRESFIIDTQNVTTTLRPLIRKLFPDLER